MAKENKGEKYFTPQEPPKPVRLSDTLRLTVTITEDSNGNLDIQTEAISVEQNKKIVLRPSHVSGLLFEAATFLAADHYSTLKEQILQNQK